MICLLCVLGYPLSASAGAELPTISSGTIEPYLSFMAGVSIPMNADATFRDGSVENIDYAMKPSIGGNGGIWFPTRDKLAGIDLGFEIAGFWWTQDINCCTYGINAQTTTEIQGIYIGGNLMARYPMAISEAYPNGRWFPYIGIGPGAHQLAYRPGGAYGATFSNPLTDNRSTAVGFQALGGVKVHLFKYLAAFAEAKYVQAHHDELGTDRYGQSGCALACGGPLVNDLYESTIRSVFVHAGLSLHFDIRP